MVKHRIVILAASALLLALFLFCSCQAKEQDNMEITHNKTVTFINGVADADIWILPETEENLKTTLWGKATVSDAKMGASCQTPLCEPGEDGLYIFRMIDTDSFFYSASGIELEADWTLQIKGDDLQSITIEVSDESGVLRNTYEVFAARL